MAKAIALVLLSAVPLAALWMIYLNRTQRRRGIGGRVIQFGLGMSLTAIMAIAMLMGLADWQAIEKLLFALIAFAAGAYVSSRTDFKKDVAGD